MDGQIEVMKNWKHQIKYVTNIIIDGTYDATENCKIYRKVAICNFQSNFVSKQTRNFESQMQLKCLSITNYYNIYEENKVVFSLTAKAFCSKSE